ncbi:MAG: hypothetical protein WCO61_04095 [Alphaproteobacteria bacterium]
MAQIPIKTRRKIDADKLRRASQAENIEFIIFIAGPYIEPDASKEPTETSAKLRFHLFQLLKDDGYDVTLGEYRELIDSYKEYFGEYHNATAAELDHAANSASIVIMIPNSPGSFAEIGAFSTSEPICQKMIILFNNKYCNEINYINLGPIKGAKDFGSTVVCVDYEQIEYCLSIVKKFAVKAKQKIFLKKTYQL